MHNSTIFVQPETQHKINLIRLRFNVGTHLRGQNLHFFVNLWPVDVYKVLQMRDAEHENVLVIFQVPGNKVTPRRDALKTLTYFLSRRDAEALRFFSLRALRLCARYFF